jgi:hypothetical protein
MMIIASGAASSALRASSGGAVRIQAISTFISICARGPLQLDRRWSVVFTAYYTVALAAAGFNADAIENCDTPPPIAMNPALWNL